MAPLCASPGESACKLGSSLYASQCEWTEGFKGIKHAQRGIRSLGPCPSRGPGSLVHNPSSEVFVKVHVVVLLSSMMTRTEGESLWHLDGNHHQRSQDCRSS
ncbi:hypothetical protein PDE_04268 [Penicillium oxalicum 114-2]|uniref:Uncharacterized protein n=1 Tax=Penicillium oxalicum (strain 114-2 / CGMCC 5302) TaxID=933388 RepID=S7ZGD1_PENO1|nr:hypothetical protein PDE_04268 [Penicillium oxalicum 114-2]